MAQAPVTLGFCEVGGVGDGLGAAGCQLIDQPCVDVTGPGPGAQRGQACVVDVDDGDFRQGCGSGSADGRVIQPKDQPLGKARDRTQGHYRQPRQCAPEAIGTPHIQSPCRGFSAHLLLFHSGIEQHFKQ